MLSVADAAAVEMFHAQDALFAENAGQWATEEVYFGYSQGGTGIYFTDDSIDFSLVRRTPAEVAESALGVPTLEDESYDYVSTHFSLSFDGAVPTVPAGANGAETVFNYHVGERIGWVDGVATYRTVVYENLYPDIDLHTFSRHGQMKYEFRVAPGADYSQIALSYDGIDGLSIADDGGLRIQTEVGEIVDEGLYIYQVIDGKAVDVDGEFVLLDEDTYTFDVTGPYDPTVELIIDPEVDWGSYLGGSEEDWAWDVATDSKGNLFVCGETVSSGWGISGGLDDTYNESYYPHDGFVAKLSGNGSHLWSTYLGGEGDDFAYGIATDSRNDVYVCGKTTSGGWGIGGGWDASFEGTSDGFVVKLSSIGSHLRSTYLGGAAGETAFDITVDSEDNVYVCGSTTSNNWGISGGWDTTASFSDGFIVKLSDTAGHIWSSYLGASGADPAKGVTTDSQDNVYVCGSTGSSDWNLSGGWDTTFGGGGFSTDGYLVKLSPAGTHLWSSYLGGMGIDEASGVAVDLQGNVYVCGKTRSSDFGISGGWDTTIGYNDDGFIVKLSAESEHLWSSYLGGAGYEDAADVTTDIQGNVYVCGQTYSSGWLSDGWDTTLDGLKDGYLITLSSDGTHVWSTYLGGSGGEDASRIATDGGGHLYIAGGTESADWDISGGWHSSHAGQGDGLVMKITAWLPGDLSADGLVGSADLDTVRANWGNDVPAGDFSMGDANGDGNVGSADLDIVRANWGAGTPAAAGAQETGQPAAATEASAFIGPRRAGVTEEALAALRDRTPGQHLSDTDLATLAEAAWLREVESLRMKRKERGAEQAPLDGLLLEATD